MTRLQIAVAGTGLMGRRHIELVEANASCELSAIVDPAPRAAKIAERVGVRLYRSLEELFNARCPDGVILATPNAVHMENGLACIRAGVPALVEKPITHTLEAGRRLCEAAEQAGAKILVGHHRDNPIVRGRDAFTQDWVACRGRGARSTSPTATRRAPWAASRAAARSSSI